MFVFSISALQSQCDEWSLINESSEWSARAGLQAVSIDNDFYIMGGRTPKPPTFPPIPGDSYIWNDVWKSTDKGLTWSKILDNDSTGSHWSARGYFQALTKNDSIFIMGGQNYKVVVNPVDSTLISLSDFFNDVWASTDGINWHQLTDSAAWSGRAGLSSVVYNGEIYVMGGSINDDAAIIGGNPQRIYFNDVWKSSNGITWNLVTDSADWAPRAGGIAIVKDGYIYMIGGEEGFLCQPGGPCPPYFNDVWRTQDGFNWELVQDEAPWPSRPGHQVVIADTNFVLFGGFGLDTLNPFNPANPIDIWISNDGANWDKLNYPPWNASSPEDIKYDFDALVSYDTDSNRTYIYSFGGDRETFNFFDPTNYLNIDNDVWRFCVSFSAFGIDTHDASFEVSIFPNPVTDYVKIDSDTKIQEIIFYNEYGIKVIEYKYNDVKGIIEIFGLSELKPGLYIIHIKSEDGLVRKKIIKS